MKNLYILLIIINIAFAQDNTNSGCLAKGTVVIYSNGLDSTPTETFMSVAKLEENSSFLNPKIEKDPDLVEYDWHHNIRFSDNVNPDDDNENIINEWKDVYASSVLKAKQLAFDRYRETWNDQKAREFIFDLSTGVSLDTVPTGSYLDIAAFILEIWANLIKKQTDEALASGNSINVERLVKKYREYLNSDKKIIALPHGEGSIASNVAFYLTFDSSYYVDGISVPDPKKRDLFVSTLIAPASDLSSKGVYRALTWDSYYERILLKLYLTPPIPNFGYFEFPLNADKYNHRFISTYLSHTVKSPREGDEYYGTLGGIIEASKLITSECKCKDVDGKEYDAKLHTNSEKNDGGLVSLEATISKNAFVAKKAVVCGRAKILGTAQILNEAFVGGMAIVKDRAKVKDWAKVYNFAIISGDAEISNLAQVYDEAKVTGKAKVGGEAHVKVRAIAAENSQITGKAILTENAIVYGEALIGNTVQGSATVGGKVKASEKVVIGGQSIVLGNVVLFDNAVVGDKAIVKDDAMMLGKSFIYGNAILAGKATIKDDSAVVDNAVVLENGKVQGKGVVLNDSFIAGNAIMTENSFLFERAFIEDDVLMAGWSMAFGDSYILEYSRISGNAFINSNFSMFENAHLSGNAYGTDRASAFGSALVYGDAHIIGNAQIFGLAHLYDFALMSGNSRAGGFAKIHGHATITGTAFVDVAGDVCGNTFLNEGYYPYPICN